MDIKKIDNSFQAALSSTQKADCDHQFKQIFDQKLDEINGTENISLVGKQGCEKLQSANWKKAQKETYVVR